MTQDQNIDYNRWANFCAGPRIFTSSISPSGIHVLRDQHSLRFCIPGPIGPFNKGIGSVDESMVASQVAQLHWNLLREDLSLPTAVLYQDKLQHNLQWMSRLIGAYGMKLAPHGKTSMAPRLFQMQLQAGAWGITLATPQQVKVAHDHGVPRVLMANQLVGKQNMSVIAHLLADTEFEFYCIVDSAKNVRQLADYFSKLDLQLNVLVELGVEGGRSGVRNEHQLNAVMEELLRCGDHIALCGVEVYEGVLSEEHSIRDFLKRTTHVVRMLAAKALFRRSPVLLSGAGSAWYDVVAEEFSVAHFDHPVEVVLRPGCYVTHDVGAYRHAQSRILSANPIAQQMSEGLKPAMHIWAYVQSLPEPNRAIMGMGKRDAAFDSGMPLPALHFRPGSDAPAPAPAHWEVTRMMDQHAFLNVDQSDNLQVGDMIAFDVCHPCLTFDKWKTLPVLDAGFQVIDLVQTFF